MKKSLKSHGTSGAIIIQEKIVELQEDLLTVLEAHMDEMGAEELFSQAFQFMTLAMYECLESHQNALKVLKLAIDAGIQAAMKKRGH